MVQLLLTALLLAASSVAAPVPQPQLGLSISTPLGGVALGTPSVLNGASYSQYGQPAVQPPPPRPYSGYSSYSPITVLPGAITSAIGDIASDVAYGIGDSIARGTGVRPSSYDSSYAWRPSSSPSYGSSYPYGYNGYSTSNRGYSRNAADGQAAAAPAAAAAPLPAAEAPVAPVAPVAAAPVVPAAPAS